MKTHNMAEINRVGSKHNLMAIRAATALCTKGSGDPEVPPSSLEELVREGFLEPASLISGMSGRNPDKVWIDENGVLSEPSDYVYIALPANAPDTLIQAYEKPENYKTGPWGEGTLIVFKQDAPISVEWMDIKQFRQALTKTKKWLAKSKFKPGPTNQAESKKNLRLIGNAIADFKNEYNAPPASLEDIFIRMSDVMVYGFSDHSEFLRALVSPASGRVPLKTDEKGVPTEAGDYIYIPLPASTPSTLIQVYEKPENYKGSELGEGTMVLFYPKDYEYESAEIKWMDLNSFQTVLEQTQKWVTEHNYGPTQATLEIETTLRSRSIGNLQQIGYKIVSYRAGHDDLPPPSLERLGEGYLGDYDFYAGDVLISPMSGRGPINRNKSLRITEKGDYVLVPLPKSAPSGLIEIYERPDDYANSPLGNGTIVLASGSEEVKWMKIEVFKQRLAQTEKWLSENGFGTQWQKLLSWEANRVESMGNLSLTVIFASGYEERENDTASLDKLLSNGDLITENVISPVSGRDLAEVKNNRNVLPASEISDYVYVSLPKSAPGDLIQAYEKPEYYNDGPWGKGTIVMFKSENKTGYFNVEWMDIKEFQERLAKTEKWLAEHKK